MVVYMLVPVIGLGMVAEQLIPHMHRSVQEALEWFTSYDRRLGIEHRELIDITLRLKRLSERLDKLSRRTDKDRLEEEVYG